MSRATRAWASRLHATLVLIAFVAGTLVATTAVVVRDQQPAHAVGSYDNAAIADRAYSYLGQWGGNACNDARKPGDSGGQCKAFVNCIVWMVSGGSQNLGGADYFAPYLAAGGQEITNINDLRRGDIVQVGQGVHTFIIDHRDADGRFWVIDSNHSYNEMVEFYKRPAFSLNSTTRAFRMGTVNTPPTTPPPPPPPPQRLAVTGSGGGVWANAWPNQLTNEHGGDIVYVAASAHRLAMISSSGTAYLKDFRSPTPSWNVLAYDVSAIAITDERIAVIGAGDHVWATDSGYAMQEVAGPATSIALSSNRLVVVGANNTAYVRVGSVTAPGWQRSVPGVASAAVSDDRFAVVSPSGGVWANEGTDINNTMHSIHGSARQVGVGTNRLAILGTDNTVYLREGPVTGSNWVVVAGNVSSLSMARGLIAVRNPQGGVWAGTGTTLTNVANDTGMVAVG